MRGELRSPTGTPRAGPSWGSGGPAPAQGKAARILSRHCYRYAARIPARARSRSAGAEARRTQERTDACPRADMHSFVSPSSRNEEIALVANRLDVLRVLGVGF